MHTRYNLIFDTFVISDKDILIWKWSICKVNGYTVNKEEAFLVWSDLFYSSLMALLHKYLCPE